MEYQGVGRSVTGTPTLACGPATPLAGNRELVDLRLRSQGTALPETVRNVDPIVDDELLEAELHLVWHLYFVSGRSR
jgi:hypothetical protein